VADWDDVRRIAGALPEVVESTSYGCVAWRVRDKSFLWERPLRQRDLDELGAAAPTGPVLAARVPDLGAKEAVLAADPGVFFTIAHFDGFAAVLARLECLTLPDLEELASEAWLARAPKRLARLFLDGQAS
jgi:hypothetical protein